MAQGMETSEKDLPIHLLRNYYPEYEQYTDEELVARLAAAEEQGIITASFGALNDVDMGGTQTLPRPEEVQQLDAVPDERPVPSLEPNLKGPREREADALRAARVDEALDDPFTRDTVSNMPLQLPSRTMRRVDEGKTTLGEDVLSGITKGGARAKGYTASKLVNAITPFARIFGASVNPELVARDMEKWLSETTAMHDPVEMEAGWYNPASPNFLKGLEKSAPGISGHVAQFVLPFAAGLSAGAPSSVSAFGTGATSFDTQEKRLSNLLRESRVLGLKLEDPITEFLAQKPGESMGTAALKNGLEWAGLDAAASGLLAGGLWTYRMGKNALKRGQNVDEVVEIGSKNPRYEQELELHAATKLLDEPVGPGGVAPTKELPKPHAIAHHVTKGGIKKSIAALKEDPTKHASEFSQNTFDHLTKQLPAGDKRAGFISISAPEGLIDAGKVAGKRWDQVVRPIKSRIIAAHPEIGPRVSTIVDAFELEQNLIAHEQLAKMEAIGGMYKRLKPADKKLWESAYKRNNTSKLYDIATRYQNNGINPGMHDAVANMYAAFDDMHKLANAHGVQLSHRADYLPLKVKSYKEFRKFIGKTTTALDDQVSAAMEANARGELFKGNSWQPRYDPASGTMIDPMADVRVNTKVGTPEYGQVFYKGQRRPNAELSPGDISEEVYKYLGKMEAGEAAAAQQAGLPFSKERVVTMTPQLEPLYGGFLETVSAYPTRLGYEIAKKRLMGKVPGMEHQGYKQVMEKMRTDLGMSLEDFAPIGEDISNLIGVRLRGGEKGIGNFAKGYRDFVYATTIGNPFSTITQSSEFALNAYRNGIINNLAGTKQATLDNLPAFLRKALKQTNEGVRMKDLGLSDIGAEWQGASTGAMNKLLMGGRLPVPGTRGIEIPGVMRLSGFKQMDVLMKESNLNGALLKAKKQLSTPKGEAAFRQRMQPFYQQETDNLIKGIRSGNKKDDLTRLYLFQELAKTQPIALSEMPEAYLKSGGGGRSAYFLKSFTLKQWETLQRDVVRQMASGNKKQVAEGFYNLMGVGLLFGGGTMGQMALKDWMLGRNSVKLNDYLNEAAWSVGGQSRFVQYQYKKGFWEGTGNLLAPPMPMLKDILYEGVGANKRPMEDIVEGWIKYAPLFGKWVHWRYGQGADQEARKRAEAIRGSRPGGRPESRRPEKRSPARPVFPRGYPQSAIGTGTVLRH